MDVSGPALAVACVAHLDLFDGEGVVLGANRRLQVSARGVAVEFGVGDVEVGQPRGVGKQGPGLGGIRVDGDHLPGGSVAARGERQREGEREGVDGFHSASKNDAAQASTSCVVTHSYMARMRLGSGSAAASIARTIESTSKGLHR